MRGMGGVDEMRHRVAILDHAFQLVERGAVVLLDANQAAISLGQFGRARRQVGKEFLARGNGHESLHFLVHKIGQGDVNFAMLFGPNFFERFVENVGHILDVVRFGTVTRYTLGFVENGVTKIFILRRI